MTPRPLKDMDGEAVDRSLAVQGLIGRKLAIVAEDVYMQFSAHLAGSDVIASTGVAHEL